MRQGYKGYLKFKQINLSKSLFLQSFEFVCEETSFKKLSSVYS
jgi:hypothetical protein